MPGGQPRRRLAELLLGRSPSRIRTSTWAILVSRRGPVSQEAVTRCPEPNRGIQRSFGKRRQDEGQDGQEVRNRLRAEPTDASLSFSLGMFRDHDFVVCLTRMTAVLVDASLRLVERFVAAESAARTAPNNVVRPRVGPPSLSVHYVQFAHSG